MLGYGEIRLLRTPAELDALESDWETLGQAAEDPLLSHTWFRAAATLHSGERLCIVELRRDNRLAGVAPLVESRRDGTRHLEFIGSKLLYEPSSLLATDPESRARLCEAIVAEGLPVALLRFPTGQGIVADFAHAARGRGFVMRVASPPCLTADLQQGWTAYFMSRSSETRRTVDKKSRRLQQSGSVDFELLHPSADKLTTVLEEVFDVEADGWKGRARSAMRENLPIRGFVQALARGFALKGKLRVAFLRVNGSAIATCVMLEHGQRLWGVKKGFRESSAAASPGMLLLHKCLHDAAERGLEAYEFLGSGDRLQPAWSTSKRTLQSLIYYPYSLRGAATFMVDVLCQLTRRNRRRRGAMRLPRKE